MSDDAKKDERKRPKKDEPKPRRHAYRPARLVLPHDYVGAGDEFHLQESGWKWGVDGVLFKPGRLKPDELSPIARSRLVEKLEAELPDEYDVEFYRRKLKQWKTRTPRADVEVRQHLAKALYRVTYGKPRRHVFCLLLDIGERQFNRLKDEGKKLSLERRNE